MHRMLRMQKEAKGAKSRMENVFVDSPEQWSIVQRLVYKKVDDIAIEFNNLFSDEAYADPKRWGLVWMHSDRDDESSVLTTARTNCVLYTLEMLCDFKVRVLDRVHSLRYQLCWLVYNAADVVCEKRKRLAQELLELFKSADRF